MKRALTLAAGLLALSTGWASRASASCFGTATVIGPGNFQTVVNAIPGTIISGDYCVTVNGGIYNEVISIGTHTFGSTSFRILISSAPGAAVVISSVNSSGALFTIGSDSVTLTGITVSAAAGPGTQYGIQVSSNYVTLSSVTVSDPNSLYSAAAVQINGVGDTVRYSSVTAKSTNAYGLMITGSASQASVLYSTASNSASGGQSALEVDGASTTVLGSYAQNLSASNALSVQFTNSISVLSSTFATTGAGSAGYLSNSYGLKVATVAFLSPTGSASALQVQASSVSLFTNMTLAGGGDGLLIGGSSHDDLISLSTITSSLNGRAAQINNSSSITVTWSVLSNSGSNNAVDVWSGGGYSLISHSSITNNSGGSFKGVYLNSPGNTVADSVVNSANGDALMIDTFAGNTVLKTSLTSGGSSGSAGLNIASAAGATITNVFAQDTNSTGAGMVFGAATSVVVTDSTGTAVNGNGIILTGGGGSTFTRGVYSVSGAGLGFNLNGSSGNTATGITAAANAGGLAVALAGTTSGSTISNSFISAAGGTGVSFTSGASTNTVNFSTITVTGLGSVAVAVSGAGTTNNIMSGDYAASAQGTAVQVSNGSGFTINSSTIASASPSSGNAAVSLGSPSSNTSIFNATIINTAGTGVLINNSSQNSMAYSTIRVSTSGQGGFGGAILAQFASTNTFFNNQVFNSTGTGLYAFNSSSITVAGGVYTSSGSNPSMAGIVFDTSFNGRIVNATANNLAAGWALYLYNSSSDTVLSSAFNAQTSQQASLFSGDANETVVLSTFTNRGSGRGLLIQNGSGYTISNSTVTAFAKEAVQMSTVTSAVLNGSVFVTLGATGASAVFDQYGTSSVFSADQFTASGGNASGALKVDSTTGDTVFNSTLTATGGTGLWVDNNTGLSVANANISGSTGALVNNSGGTFFNTSTLTGSGGKAALLITNAVAFATTTVQGTTLNAPGAQYALRESGSPQASTLLNSAVTLSGNVTHDAGGLNLANGIEVVSGDVSIGTFAYVAASNSSFTFTGAAQTVTLIGPAQFDKLVQATANNLAFLSTFTATSLTDAVSGSTLAFAPAGVSGSYQIGFLNLKGATGLGGLINIHSTSPGTAAIVSVVGGSTVTLAAVRDLNGSAGSPVFANDGRSLDLGNNSNWIFAPFLVVQAPGEGWSDGVGKTGGPTNQTAGVGGSYTIRAVSASTSTVSGASFSVTLMSNDPYGSSAQTSALSGGVVNFPSFTLKIAEPSPFNTVVTATGPVPNSFYGNGTVTVPVVPAAPTKLQLIMNGETELPGSPSGKTGTPTGVVAGVPMPFKVRGVDAFWNKVPSTSASVIASLPAFIAGVNLPQTQALVSGTTNFIGAVYPSSATGLTIAATDPTLSLASSTGTPFVIFAVTNSSPTVSVNLANNSVQTTLGGAITGTASDPSGVTKVTVQLQGVVSGQYLNFNTLSFGAPAVSTTATLSNPGGQTTAWGVPIPDSPPLTAGASYFVIVQSSNASNNVVTSNSLFTFNPSFGVVGTPGDGQGAASMVFVNGGAPTVIDPTGCMPKVASMTFVVGPAGMGSGGGIALRIPDYWGILTATTNFNPPPTNGYLFVGSPYPYSITLNPPSQSSTTFGTNWALYSPTAALPAGTSIYFSFQGFPSAAAGSVGPQAFPFMTSGGANGLFKPISTPAISTLNPGQPRSISFSQQSPLTLGPLQPSPTAQVVLADQCLNPTVAGGPIQVDLWAGPFGSSRGVGDDSGAVFYSTGGTLLAPSKVMIDPGQGASHPFYFQTATAGPLFELLFATATFGGGPTVVATAVRPLQVLASSVSLSAVSIDTGTLSPGVTQATITAGGFTGAAVINFTLSNPNLPWEIIISTSATTYTPELVHRNGYGQPGRTLSWNGISDFFPQTLVPPGGPYYIKIRVGNGVLEDTSLSAYMAPSAFVYGTVNSTGAYAYVQAQGPNTSYANFAVASSTGYFQIFGLQNGGRYNIVATSGAVIGGQFMTLTASSNNATASNAGSDLGAMPFPTPALLRVRVQIPNPAVSEFWGGVNAQSPTTGAQGFGTLHYLAAADKSDDGRQAFGGTASSWTVMGLLAGTYNLNIGLQQVGISSSIPSVVVNPGVNDLFVPLARQANVYGYAVAPSTTQYGTWISVQGTKAGDARPTAFGGAFLNGGQYGTPQSSNTYSLFGLDPGSWTITARAFGFASASTSVYISSNADIGVPNGPGGSGLDLTLSSGGVISGVIKIFGDSTSLPAKNNSTSGLNLFINAFNPKTYTSGFAQVFIATSSTLAVSTFSITGLDDGAYFMNTFIAGAQPIQSSVTVSGGAGSAVMTTAVNNARVVLGIKMPAGITPYFSGPYHSVSLYYTGQSVSPTVIPDVAFAGSTITFNFSSATWTSPPLGAGYFNFTAFNNTTGANQSVSVPLSNNTTAFALLDLSPSTFSVSGTVAFGAQINFQSGVNAVAVSSVPGVLFYSTATAYCLQGSNSSNGLTLSNFHLELIPVNQQGGFLTAPLKSVAQIGGNCLAPDLSQGGQGGGGGGNNGNVDPMLAYTAVINNNGTFQFNNVPPGTYLMRVPTVLGTDPNIEQLPPARQVVTVTTYSIAGLSFPIGSGVVVSGNVKLPPGLTDSRTLQISLADSDGNTIKTTYANIANSNAGTYAFDRVPDGNLAVLVQDFGYPRGYGARPISLKVAGTAIQQDIQLVQTGVIKGKLAVQQFLPNSTTAQFTLITGSNLNQMPHNLQVYAEAKPWFQGGRANPDCFGGPAVGGGFCGGLSLDANDQFVISGVLPGLYDVHFQSYNDPTDNGNLKLVSSYAPGVQVNGAATTDIGTFNLTGALTLRGTVYDVVTSSPIPNMPMKAKPSTNGNQGSDNPSATTDGSGNYTLVGLDPTIKVYDIYAGARSDHGTSGSIPPYELKIAPSVDVTSVSVVNFGLNPAAYSFSGQVLGVAGGPALLQPFGDNNAVATAGAMVFCQKIGVAPHDNPIADIQQPSDPQGNFTIPSLTTGTYKLTAVALGYASTSKTVAITTASVNVGTMRLSLGATLSGALRKPDGSSPSQHELNTVVAVTNDFSQLIVATLTKDPNTNSISAYSLAGFQPGVSYRVLLFGDNDNGTAPPEAQNIVFSTTTETRTLDILMRPAAPFVFSKARKSGGTFKVHLELSQPLRQKLASDDDLTAILSTFSAAGTLTQIQLDATRSHLTAVYIPGVTESSFTLRLHGYSTQTDPNSLDPVNPQFVYDSTYAYFSGLDGYYANILSNFNGGTLLVEDDNGRVAIPGGAFQVDASSSISIGLAVSAETLAGAATSGLHGAAANIKAMRFNGNAYPQELFRAMAATPAGINPLSSFYNILLPLGLRTALAKPVPMTISYSTSTDPTTLNLYWYNAAANAYVLQQDVLGNKPVIDTVNHTITINVNHFSTFVMFNTGVAVISGNQFSGDFTAYNFPNPFDLSVKSVSPIHGVPAQTVRGTMISIAVPQDVSGDASVKIFNVAGQKVRTIDLGTVTGGQYLYQPWDGRNDSGRDVASGVYIGQVKIGNRSKFFKMALIK